MTPLSANAVRLLAAMKSLGATAPESAVTDARLAAACRLNKRYIIDAACELLNAGVGVVATCNGRFLTKDVKHLRSYEGRLSNRHAHMYRRTQAVKRCLELMDRRQLTLREAAS